MELYINPFGPSQAFSLIPKKCQDELAPYGFLIVQ